MSLETRSITADDGHRFELRWAVPTGAPRAAVVVFPAMGVRASYYDALARAFAAVGVACVVSELRGQGTSSLRASRSVDWGYVDAVTQDWPATIGAARERVGDLPLYILGHSLGGQLSSLYLAQNPTAVSGLVLVAAGTNYFRSWPFPRNLAILAQTQLAGALARVLGYFPGSRLGFGDLQARREMKDWSANARTGRYRPAKATFDYEAAFEKVTKPVLAISVDGDELAPPLAALHLLGKFTGARRRHLHLTSAELPRAALDHFKWARHPKALASIVLRELAEQA